MIVKEPRARGKERRPLVKGRRRRSKERRPSAKARRKRVSGRTANRPGSQHVPRAKGVGISFSRPRRFVAAANRDGSRSGGGKGHQKKVARGGRLLSSFHPRSSPHQSRPAVKRFKVRQPF